MHVSNLHTINVLNRFVLTKEISPMVAVQLYALQLNLQPTQKTHVKQTLPGCNKLWSHFIW